jgi:multidrug efflux pump subunit AcrB
VKRLIAWFAENGVAANLLMFVVLFAGLITAPTIRQEVFPEFETDRVTVTVPYPGATPAEIEEGINVRIEESIASLEGVKKITSTAAEGVGAVTVEALPEADVRALLDDVKSEVDAIDTFPEEAEQPLVSELVVRHRVLTIAIHGVEDERSLKSLAERVRDDLSTLPEITQVELYSVRDDEVSIEVSEQALRRYGITFDDVADAVRDSSLDLPGGSIKTDAGEVLLRAKGQAYRGRDFERIVLLTRPDGSRVYLEDVATVVDGFADTDQRAVFDGEPAAMVQVYRVGEQSALAIAAAAKAYVAEAAGRMPAGVKLTVWDDDTQVLRDRLDTLRRNGLQGLVLVFLTLAFFLQFRLALWTTAGIPVAFLGALWLMPALGVSINVLSLFSFILVLGIVVDDAIVVGENVYKKKEEGMSGLAAVVEGAQEVAIPVIFGVLTTVAVFCPMLALPGITGNIMTVFPLVVIPTLLFSLVESQLVLPAHLRHVVADGAGPKRGIEARWKRVQGAVARGLARFIDEAYEPTLDVALRWRYTVAALAVAVLIVTASVVGAGWIRMRFFPDAEADRVVAELTMPQGTPAASTDRALARLEQAALRVRDEFDDRVKSDDVHSIVHILRSLGEQPGAAGGGRRGPSRSTGGGAHLGEVNLQLAPAELRRFSSIEVANRWRELAGQIPDATELRFQGSLFHGGDAIDVQLSSQSLEDLQSAAERLKVVLARYPGVSEVADSFEPGKEEIKLTIRPEAESLGLTLADLARQVRQAFYGEEAQRVQRGREDIKVMVRYPASERVSLADIENMRIRTPSGSEVPFSTVASVRYGRGYATIQRADRQRYISVTADVDAKKGNANEILADVRENVLPDLIADYQGLRYSLEGEQREQIDTFDGLRRGFLLALFVIYALMAVPLKSYTQPLIVMTAIPFGIVGAVWAHIALGMNLSFMSVFGIVALVGVVVNDSLVLVDYVNRSRREGKALHDVVREAGAARFRPILLTSLTTFAGLTPLLLERSFQAQFLIPMAVSLGFGVLFATAISLVLVPCTYLIVDDVGRLLGGGSDRTRPSEPDAVPSTAGRRAGQRPARRDRRAIGL